MSGHEADLDHSEVYGITAATLKGNQTRTRDGAVRTEKAKERGWERDNCHV